MATIIRTVHWTVLPHAGDPVVLLRSAVARTGFALVSATAFSIVIGIPRAIIKNRWAATTTGVFSVRAGGTDIQWTVGGLGNKHYELMLTTAEGMPEGSLDDRGTPETVSRIVLTLLGRREIRHLANILDRGEFVHAIGVGNLGARMGIVALTQRRMVFLEKSLGWRLPSLGRESGFGVEHCVTVGDPGPGTGICLKPRVALARQDGHRC